MQINDFNEANALLATINKITAIQTRIALEGSKGFLMVVTGTNTEIVSGADIIAAITEDSYDIICANALTALNTALASAKVAAQLDFGELGAS